MTYNTLQHGEHTSRDVTLVTLGFHMCGHCLSMLIPFFRLKERQIRFGRIDLVWANCYRANWLSGKTTWHQTIGSPQPELLDKSIWFSKASIHFFCKPMVINKPAVASARLLGIGSKLYPHNMPCMLSNYLTRITQGLSRVRKNRSGERKPLLTGCCYWRPTEKVFKPDYSTKLESCT